MRPSPPSRPPRPVRAFLLVLSDVWNTWRAHPARMFPVALALWAGLAALMGLLCARDALRLEAERLSARLGVDAFAVRRTGDAPPGAPPAGWSPRAVEALRDALAGDAWLGGESAPVELEAAGRGERVAIAAMSGDFARARDWRWTPRPPDALDLHSPRRAVWVAREAAVRWALAPGQTLVLDGSPWVVEGLVDAGAPGEASAPPLLWTSAPALEAWLAPESLPARTLWVRARRPGTAPAVRRRLERALGADAPSVDWLTPERLSAHLRRWRRALGAALGWTSALCLLLAAAGMASLQWMAVRERIPEIGLRRALGARPADIAALFLAEALLLTLLASLAAALALLLLLPRLDAFSPLPLRPTPLSLLLPPLLTLLLALLASAPPARAAARLDPSEALRST